MCVCVRVCVCVRTLVTFISLSFYLIWLVIMVNNNYGVGVSCCHGLSCVHTYTYIVPIP